MSSQLRIGSRGSKLALWQAHWVRDRLHERYPEIEIQIEIIKTTGDKILDVSLSKLGGRGVFTKEIEEAMLEGRIDLAVHSLKDLPTTLPPELHIAAITEREDARDALLTTGKATCLLSLSQNAVVGTSSLRRQAQLRAVRPDLHLADLRGNVDTRIKKLQAGEYEAIILAAAGLKRLGHADLITAFLDFEVMLPAIGQGALAIEARIDDARTNGLLQFLIHEPTLAAITAERALLRQLGGGCQVPIAGHGVVSGGRLRLTGLVSSLDGQTVIRAAKEGDSVNAETIGAELGNFLLQQGAEGILQQVYASDQASDDLR